MYSYVNKDNHESSKTAKGIKKIVFRKDIKQKDYKTHWCEVYMK